MSLIRELADRGLAGCAQLGLVTPGPHRSWGPCPVCGATRRSESSRTDRRGPLHSRSGLGWWCVRCDARGDAADLISIYATGRRIRDLSREDWSALRTWVEDRGVVDAPPPPPPPPPPAPPPRAEVEALWASAWDLRGPRPWGDEDPAAAWLQRRARADLEAVAETGLARILPPGYCAPKWWPYRDDYRVLIPAYDGMLRLRSLLGRAHDPDVVLERGKERSPIGYGRAGLVLLSAAALAVYRDRPARAVVVVAEGPTDAIRAAVRGAAVVGIYSGSAPALAALPWPTEARVVISTDDDEAGARLMQHAEQCLPRHCRVLRG